MQKPVRWRLGVLAAMAMTLLALFPQAHLWYKRGSDWQGVYASFDGDEAAYAAYVGALIAGRPRRNDPYTGHEDQPNAPLPESLFSIQFVPPYLLALPARVLKLKAPMLFVILSPFIAFTASLALFWLLLMLLKDGRFAAAGLIVIFCLGVFASGQGTLLALMGRRTHPIFLPFLRRYVPAVPFPLLFLFFAFVWRALMIEARRARWTSALGAGLIFALLVFSYFYLWTTAAAWLACLALLWLATSKDAGRRRALKIFAVLAAFAALSLAPYALLLTHRAATMDTVQVLQFTHAPDLRRAPELIGFATLLLLAFGAWRKSLDARNPATVFSASFALTPFAVFNQQVLTGLSLQPIHYNVFTLNYVALLAFVLTVGLLRQRGSTDTSETRSVPRLLAAVVTLAAYGLCSIDTIKATRMHESINLLRDEQLQVSWRMEEIGRAANAQRAERPIALVTHLMLADSLPIVAPQAVLWSPHMLVNSGLTTGQYKERMYQYFYYTGIEPEDFPSFLAANRIIIYMLFGPDRAMPHLTTGFVPVTPEEISREQRSYAGYVAAFNQEQAARPTLSFVVTSSDRPLNLSRLDRWYERDAGERVGDYMIHRVQLRP